jgi:two-component system NarL family sensor kinase
MHHQDPETLIILTLISVFFLLLIVAIILTALLYHSRKRRHMLEVANFQNVLLESQWEAKEQTMQTIGADLHDNIGQLLSLIALMLGSVEAEEGTRIQQKVDAALELTTQSLTELRLLGKLMHGEQLLASSLCEAIEKVINWIAKSGKYQVNLQCGPLPKPMNHNKDLIIFRVVQETLTNIVKHALATEINIEILSESESLNIVIADNGVGFELSEVRDVQKGMGLFNLHKRIKAIGGEVNIKTSTGMGSTVEIIVPYP